jgi:hypothetical protein
MSNTNALSVLEPQSLTELKGVAQVFAESGMFSDARGMAQAFVKIMAGREAGFGAFASMQNVNIIQGKPSFNSQMMAAAVKRHEKYDYHVEKMAETECVIVFYEEGQVIGESAFTMADAQQAGVTGNKTWQKYPRNMLFARAMSNGVRWYCPDVFSMAVYTADELGEAETPVDFDPDDPGSIIDGKFVEPGDEPAQEPKDASPFPPRQNKSELDDFFPRGTETEDDINTTPEGPTLFELGNAQGMVDYVGDKSADIDTKAHGWRYHAGSRARKALGVEKWEELVGRDKRELLATLDDYIEQKNAELAED